MPKLPSNELRYWVIVPAAGIGSRMNTDCPKQYLRVEGRYILDYALDTFLNSPQIHSVVISLKEDDAYWRKTSASKDAKVSVCVGGKQRAESVCNALEHISTQVADEDWVLVHDASRPCLSAKDLDKLMALSADEAGGILAVPMSDAVKEADADGYIKQSADRSDLWRALTPQMFKYKLLYDAMCQALKENTIPEDEATAMTRSGHSVRLVEGCASNVKLTRPDDLDLVAAVLSDRKRRDRK